MAIKNSNFSSHSTTFEKSTLTMKFKMKVIMCTIHGLLSLCMKHEHEFMSYYLMIKLHLKIGCNAPLN